VRQERKVPQVHKVFKVRKENEVIRVLKVLKVNRVLAVNRDPQEQLVQEVLQVHPANKVEQECRRKIKFCLRNYYRY
jgi:hypothetical protein